MQGIWEELSAHLRELNWVLWISSQKARSDWWLCAPGSYLYGPLILTVLSGSGVLPGKDMPLPAPSNSGCTCLSNRCSSKTQVASITLSFVAWQPVTEHVMHFVCWFFFLSGDNETKDILYQSLSNQLVSRFEMIQLMFWAYILKIIF